MSEPGGDERSPAEVEAAERGRAMVAEARAIRRRMLDDADQRRRALVAELQRVRAEIDAAIAALAETEPGAGDTPAPAAPTTDAAVTPAAPPSEGAPARVHALFDELRAETPAPVPKAPRSSTPRRATKREAGGAAPEHEEVASEATDAEREVAVPEAPVVSAPPPEQPGDALRRRRAALLEPLVPEVVRVSKRLLQDEQNSLLDAARRARGRPEPARLLPEPGHQRESWTALLAPAIDAAYLGGRAAAGKTGRVTSAPTRIVVELAALLVTPLRERLTATIESIVAEGPYESVNELQRALGSAIGARYREWRTVDLEEHVVDVLAASYARGAYDAAAPAAMLQWVPAEPGRCPDCDDNALEPTLKGKAFPTGQQHPPAHPGCRCLVVPYEG